MVSVFVQSHPPTGKLGRRFLTNRDEPMRCPRPVLVGSAGRPRHTRVTTAEEDTLMQELKGKVAVVTGGASGIGFGLAARAGHEGMTVVVCDVEQGALDKAVATLRERGYPAHGRRVDVRSEAEVNATADWAFAEFGAVHLLCNNAGVITKDAPAWEASMTDWQWVLGVNLWGVIHGVRAFVPRMIAGGEEGHIVNTSSMAGLVTGRIGSAVYDASKHAVLALSESLYRDLAITTPKVSASVLCPGAVMTNIFAAERNRPKDLGGTGAPSDVGRTAFSGDSLTPDDMANEVFDAIAAGRFYVLAAQTEMYEFTKMGHDRMWEGRNPAVPHRLLAARDH